MSFKNCIATVRNPVRDALRQDSLGEHTENTEILTADCVDYRGFIICHSAKLVLSKVEGAGIHFAGAIRNTRYKRREPNDKNCLVFGVNWEDKSLL